MPRKRAETEAVEYEAFRDEAASGRHEISRSAERLRVLGQATQMFSDASGSPEAVFEVVVREVAETLSCVCVLHLVAEDGLHSTTPHVHASDWERHGGLAAQLRDTTPREIASRPALRHVVATRSPLFVPRLDVAADPLDPDSARELIAFSRQFGVRSGLMVPLLVRGRVLGALALLRGPSLPAFDESDLSFAQSLAVHSALALTAAQLLQASERELLERERMAARLRVLAEASHDFSDATGDYDRLFAVIARRLGAAVGDLCAVRAVSDDGSMLERGAVYHRDREISARAAQILLGEPKSVRNGTMGKVATSGKVLFNPAVITADYVASSTTPEYQQMIVDLQVSGVMMVPVTCREKVVAVAALLRSGSHNPYTEADLQLTCSVAEYAGLAIENARSYQSERAAVALANQANGALLQSENAHRLLFEASPVPMLVFAVTTSMVLAANQAAVELYGYAQEELLQMTLADLRRASERELVWKALAGAGERELAGFAWHRRKDGGEFRSRSLDFAGHRARIVVITDVTARYEAEETRALLGAIVLSSNDAIVSKNLGGTITSWNAGAERLFGYSADEVLGGSINLLIPPELLLEERELLGRIAAGDRVEHYETVRRRKDGKLVHVSLSLAPICDAAGVVIGASKTARDLTSQLESMAALRSTEEQLRQAQKMEAVGRLAGGVAHDFNNVLSVILGHSGMILEDLKASDPLREEITEIQSAGLRAADLTRQLLMFSRQQVVAPRVLDLNEILLGMDKMLQRLVGEDVDLVAVPAAKLGRIRADPSNVDQVILNLVVNARDAMPRGGKITIETANVQLGEDYAREHLGARPGAHVMLAVSDTGSGMDAATQQRIFEPFFTTKAAGKGTGLGLSTVFGIVQQSGGTVWVYSELGAGTTFKVYFPRVEAAPDTVPPPPSPGRLRGRETVLLVEDQDQVRSVARDILKRSGYRVLVARRPGEALLLCEQHEGCIDLLVTDVVMPQLSGVELAKRMTAMRPQLKALYMSGYTDDSIVRHGVLESEMAFLQKPFTPESLAGKVRDVIDGTLG